MTIYIEDKNERLQVVVGHRQWDVLFRGMTRRHILESVKRHSQGAMAAAVQEWSDSPLGRERRPLPLDSTLCFLSWGTFDAALARVARP